MTDSIFYHGKTPQIGLASKSRSRLNARHSHKDVNVENTNKFEIPVNKFNEEAADKFHKQLMEASALDSNHPITILIDSYGGYVYSLIHMLESLSQVPNPIITVCKGKAMSCGALLLAVGDQRFCGKESSIMIHEMSSGAMGNVDDIKWEADECVRLNAQIMGKLAKAMNMTYEQLKAKITEGGRRDWYLSAEEAKELGLVQHIGMPLVKTLTMHTIEVVPTKKVVFEKADQQVKTKPKPKKKKVAAKPKKKKTDSKKKGK